MARCACPFHTPTCHTGVVPILWTVGETTCWGFLTRSEPAVFLVRTDCDTEEMTMTRFATDVEATNAVRREVGLRPQPQVVDGIKVLHDGHTLTLCEYMRHVSAHPAPGPPPGGSPPPVDLPTCECRVQGPPPSAPRRKRPKAPPKKAKRPPDSPPPEPESEEEEPDGAVRSRSYDIAKLGGTAEVQTLATLNPTWNEETVVEILHQSGLPPLHSIDQVVQYSKCLQAQCTFVDPRGRLVRDVWLPFGLLQGKYPRVARTAVLPSTASD